MDPFSILGVDPDVSERELRAAYRRQAKRSHPDRGAAGDGRMAALNAAYASARRELERAAAMRTAAEPRLRARPAPGTWLPPALRRRLGWELLTALAQDERVALVADAGGRGRGPARLALTDRRLLWLLEDAVSARVDWVRFGIVSEVEVRRPLWRRERRVLEIRTKTGRRVVFGDLEPEVAATIARRLRTA